MAVAKQKKSALAQWVEAALKHGDGMSQSELARRLSKQLRLEYDRSKVNKMVQDERKVSADELLAIEEITGYPAPAALREPVKAEASIFWVPVVDSVPAGKLSAPLSQLTDEDIPKIPFAELGNGDFIALTVRGDSMDRISPDGSMILIDRADRELIAGRSYVFSVRGEVTFKMFRNNPARLQPHSWNAIHEARFVKSRDEAAKFVVGRVKRTLLDL